eukprot:1155398-Pelagomonas_calceolata.AAC.2
MGSSRRCPLACLTSSDCWALHQERILGGLGGWGGGPENRLVICCRTLYNPLLSMSSCWCEGKGWIGMLGTLGCGSGGALCTKNLNIPYLNTPTSVSNMQMFSYKYFNNIGVQYVLNVCTSRSPL